MRRLRTFTLHVVCTCVFASAAFAQQPPAPFSGVPDRESRTYDDTWSYGNTQAWPESITDDGRFVVFSSSVPRIVPNDTNGFMDVFRRDRLTRQTVRVSVNTGNDQANWDSDYPTISGDGRHVAFRSSASNLVPGDTNGHMDFFVRDVEEGTTVLLSIGPSGERLTASATDLLAISQDGRYVAFLGTFGFWPNGYQRRQVWLRDRDADENGTFDEPDTSTTTLISRNVHGEESNGWPTSVSISADGRWVAFASDAADLPGAPQPVYGAGVSQGIYAHDRLSGHTVRVDVSAMTPPDGVWQSSWDPRLSADGRYVLYTSNVAGLVATDLEGDEDLFYFDLFAGGNRQVPVLVPETGAPFQRYFGTSISGDGSRIGFVGADAADGTNRYRGFVYDVAAGVSYEVGAQQPVSYAGGIQLVDLSADGTAALFGSSDNIVADSFSADVFVAVPFATSTHEIEVSSNGGTFSFGVQAPANTTWMARSWYEHVTFNQASGTGDGVVEFTVGPNTFDYAEDAWIYVGSEIVRIRQPHVPVIHDIAPFAGPVGGGSDLYVYGQHFVSGATVHVGAAEAVSVEVLDATLIRVVTPPSADGRAGEARITVTNPDGGTTTTMFPFLYEDTTPPVVEAAILGTRGANGWYVSDVTVQWTVSDPESDIETGCPSFTLTEDSASFRIPCWVRSGGGDTFVDVEVKRDATPPTIVAGTPWPAWIGEPLRAARGESIRAFYTCLDDVSGVGTCEGPVASDGLLDTSEAGAFSFVINAHDQAGNQAQLSLPYFVRGPVVLSAVSGSGVYQGRPTIRATLTADGEPLAGKLVKFYTSGIHFATAWTSANGEAATEAYNWLPDAGLHEIVAVFDGDELYDTGSASGVVQIAKLSPTITWGTLTSMTYPAPLSPYALTAAANYPGTFTYDPAPGTVLLPGEHVVTATFMPSDVANFNVVSATRTLTVVKGKPTLTWPAPAPIVWGTPLSSTQLNATANVPGTFAYTPGAGHVFDVGSWGIGVTFTPDDPNYESASGGHVLDVTRVIPTITWDAPAPIHYGELLTSTQLNAVASVPGTYVYTPGPGAIGIGTHTLRVDFTPTDWYRYKPVSAFTTLTVLKGIPLIAWTDPAPVSYGTALGSAQLNATVSMSGTYSYSPAAGTVLPAGTHTLSVTFTPSPAYAPYYTTATMTASLTVVKTAAVLQWAEPSAISYGTPLGAAQLNATSNVAGVLSYSPAAGTVLGAGTHTLNVTFTPDDAANYTGATAAVTLTVAKAPLTIIANNAAKVYGAPLPVFTASGTGFVNGDSMASLSGTLSFSTAATAASAPGTYAVVPGGLTSPNYTVSFAAATLTVNKASTTVVLTTSPNPSQHNKAVQLRADVAAVAPGAGVATGTIEFRDNGTLLGTAPLVNGVATLSVTMRRGTHPLTAAYAGNANFNGSTGALTHQTN